MTLATNITLALNHAMSYAAAIDDARKDAKGMTRDQVKAVILPIVSSKFGVTLKDGEGKAKGTKVLDATATKYEAAKKATQRLLTDICGSASSGKTEKVNAPKKLLANIVSEIIDSGITKAEFDALISELRASVSFQ